MPEESVLGDTSTRHDLHIFALLRVDTLEQIWSTPNSLRYDRSS